MDNDFPDNLENIITGEELFHGDNNGNSSSGIGGVSFGDDIDMMPVKDELDTIEHGMAHHRAMDRDGDVEMIDGPGNYRVPEGSNPAIQPKNAALQFEVDASRAIATIQQQQPSMLRSMNVTAFNEVSLAFFLDECTVPVSVDVVLYGGQGPFFVCCPRFLVSFCISLL